MFKVIRAQPLPSYRLLLRFEDGVEGEVDLSDLVGRGVFKAWNDIRRFEDVSIGEGGELRWRNDLDLCPDALYMKVTGASAADLFPSLRATAGWK